MLSLAMIVVALFVILLIGFPVLTVGGGMILFVIGDIAFGIFAIYMIAKLVKKLFGKKEEAKK